MNVFEHIEAVTDILTRPKKNLVINGNFDIWQRGSSQTISGYGSADRWKSVFSGSSTQAVSRQNFDLTQTDVPNHPKYFYRNIVTSGNTSSSNTYLQQRIEDLRSLQGKTLTVSFYVKSSTTLNVAVETVKSYGTGGTPTNDVTAIGTTKFSTGTSWTRVEHTFTVPVDGIGSTYGTDKNDCLIVMFWFDAGSDFNSRTDSLGNQSGTFDVAQVQVEEGLSATNFDLRPISQELLMCQRYFAKSYNIDDAPGTITTQGQFGQMVEASNNYFSFGGPLLFQTRMRISPTVVVYNPVTGSTSEPIRNYTNNSNYAAGVATYEYYSYIYVNNISVPVGHYCAYHYTADAEL